MSYAGFWKRGIAYMIDGIVFNVSIVLVSFIVVTVVGTDAPTILKGMIEDMSDFSRGIIGLLGPIIIWGYFAVMESSPTQGTLGKMALGIKVTDLEGNKISFGRAAARNFGKFISFIILIGIIMIVFTQKKQGLHDIMAGCLVVNK